MSNTGGHANTQQSTIGTGVASIGARTLQIAGEVGGITVLLGHVLRCLVPPRFDRSELMRNMYKMGNRSVGIVALTAFFAGALMVIQSGVYIRRYNAAGLIGWGTGYAVFREIGPILIALMFSGRVGAHNTAELSTMTVTEQLDGLRALAIDPIQYLIVPRVVAMTICLFALTVLGNLVAVGGALTFSNYVLNVEYATFFHSLVDNITISDLTHGLVKSIVFGLFIALSSCHFGIRVRGGAVGVGHAVNAAVVAAAVSIMLLDFFITFLFG